LKNGSNGKTIVALSMAVASPTLGPMKRTNQRNFPRQSLFAPCKVLYRAWRKKRKSAAANNLKAFWNQWLAIKSGAGIPHAMSKREKAMGIILESNVR
jgi:hypothetical protein